jgi:hypothetical protein
MEDTRVSDIGENDRQSHHAWMSTRRKGERRVACYAALIRAGTAAVSVLLVVTAHAQDMEPRAYSLAPVGTNFVIMDYSYLRGGVLTDPSVPVTDINAKIDAYILAYAHSFGLTGRLASLAVVVPYMRADVTGEVFDEPASAYRSGMGDVRMRFSMNLMGNTALSPQEFAQRVPTTSVGVSLSIVAPTGQYVPTRLINVGANRWAFKPEIGISQPIGDWFAEGSAGVWLYTDNDDFFGGQHKSQDPLWLYQLHGGYNFRPGLWIAADVAYNTGGRTTLNGVRMQDMQKNSRYGTTLSVPLGAGWQTKFAWSRGFATRVGGDFDLYSVALQYRWFDR